VKAIERRKIEVGKRKILGRLDNARGRFSVRPVIGRAGIQYELADRTRAISCGGIGTMLALARQLGLDRSINQRLHLLKVNLPYHESDHVLNIAFNALCGGSCLDDIELRRNDAAFLDALGVDCIPDPTTAGDFCRRFDAEAVRQLQEAIHETRLKVWKQQPAAFFEEAVIDVDGTLVGTTGECKQGMEYSYKGIWGYHPLLVTLANTGEVLWLANRPGNRPSYEGAHAYLDDTIDLVRRAGFRKVRLRGDTDFTQTKRLDAWSDIPNLRFVFGIDASPTLKDRAEALPAAVWTPLHRRDKHPRHGPPRQRPEKVKEALVIAHGFENLETIAEDIAEFDYQPGNCRKTYRVVVVRKTIDHRRGQQWLFDEFVYFFYLTNARDWTNEEVVFEANDRCDQENLIGQLKSGVRALSAPVNTLDANWAYMVMTALAWNLKAWWALCLPETGRWSQQHREQKQTVLRMEFKRFVQAFLAIPCQIVKTARRMVYRILSWNPWQHVFYRQARNLRL
jgi:hypothetical protein